MRTELLAAVTNHLSDMKFVMFGEVLMYVYSFAYKVKKNTDLWYEDTELWNEIWDSALPLLNRKLTHDWSDPIHRLNLIDALCFLTHQLRSPNDFKIRYINLLYEYKVI